MTNLEMIEKCSDLYKEEKAYLNAYEVTGDDSLLLIAHNLQDDRMNIEIELMNYYN